MYRAIGSSRCNLRRSDGAQGFTHLAVEGLSASSNTTALGYVSLDHPGTGAYTADPEFAYLLREAIALGYKLVSHEVFNTRTIEERESGQARNIARIFDTNPGAKVFVYAGFGHIRESPNQSNIETMAMIVQKLTGIDAFSIDQEGGTPSYYTVSTDARWHDVASDLQGRSRVFKRDGRWLTSDSYKNTVDITVFHPSSKFVNGRPNWLFDGRRRHVVKSGKLGDRRPAIVRAILTSDRNGVPIDQVYLKDREDVTLLLPPGTYDIEVENLDEGNRYLYRAEVKDS